NPLRLRAHDEFCRVETGCTEGDRRVVRETDALSGLSKKAVFHLGFTLLGMKHRDGVFTLRHVTEITASLAPTDGALHAMQRPFLDTPAVGIGKQTTTYNARVAAGLTDLNRQWARERRRGRQQSEKRHTDEHAFIALHGNGKLGHEHLSAHVRKDGGWWGIVGQQFTGRIQERHL